MLKVPAPYVMPWMIRALRFRLPDALWQVESPLPSIALTFDDGPGRFTPALLDVLKKEKVPATFFTVGDRVERYPDILRRARAEGHLIGIHTYHHRSIKKMSESELRRDLVRCREKISEVLSPWKEPDSWFFRPPHGACTPGKLRLLLSENIVPVMFGIVPGLQLMPRGWTEEPKRTCRRILRAVKAGSIIALHDGEYFKKSDNIFDCHQVAETAALLIPQLKKLGYRFTTPADS